MFDSLIREIEKWGGFLLPREAHHYIEFVLPQANSIYIKAQLVQIGAVLGKSGFNFTIDSNFDKQENILKVYGV